eukprot:1189934-Prorocentrum_minimum.AAC.4
MFHAHQAPAKCLRVLEHLKDKHWMDLWKEEAADMDSLVVHESKVLSIIGKFEPTKFIHVYTNNNQDCFKVELPRYHMEFELRKGQLASVEHQGYTCHNHNSVSY